MTIRREMFEVNRAFATKFYPDLDRRLGIGDAYEKLLEAQAHAFMNVHRIERLVRPYEDALRAMYAAILIGTWTAFETLLGDLWEAALNTAPKTLARLSGSPHRIWERVKKSRESAGVRD